MEYTKKFNDLKALFRPEEYEIHIPDSDISIYNVDFMSDVPANVFINPDDTLIPENHSFSYPVFAPVNHKSEKVILLLHGLNERSWIKYLVWAFYLAESTGCWVILFPISFHINRSPVAWRDPRAMANLIRERDSITGVVPMESFANIAISNRLTEDPLRFFSSGYQTVSDIVKLLQSVRNGEHAVIPRSSSFNIFSYSIGAFLAEIILMGNPGKLFSDSKLFIFCGGSVFSNMRGSSKLIMDNRAFVRIYNYYLNEFEKTIEGKRAFSEFLNSSQIGMAFRSMIDFGRFKSFRETLLKKLCNQIHTISLRNDTVIPPAGVVATLNNLNNSNIVEVWDFPYSYSHENPFPIFDSPLKNNVDNCFNKVFSAARAFLI